MIALSSGWPTVIEAQTKGHNQPTGSYDEDPAMNWSAGVGESGLALAIDTQQRACHNCCSILVRID